MIDVELTNATSNAIRLAACAVSLERRDAAGGWDEVWSLACAAIARSTNTDVIPAGASKTLTIRVTAQGSGDTWPSTGLDGVYRVRLNVFPSEEIIKRMASVTNSISATPVVTNEFSFLAS